MFCVEAIGPGPRRPAPHRGAARAASAHGAKRRHRPPTPRRHAGGRARLAHRRSRRCSQKSGDRPTKTRSFCAITPRFLRRGGSAAAKGRKAARNHGCNHRKDKNINLSPPNHQQKHVFTPCTSGEMQAEIRTFRRFRGKQGAEYSFYFKASRTKVDILRNFLIMNQLVTNNLILARVLHGCQTSDLLRSNEIISSLSLKCSSNCAMRARSSSFSFAMSVEPERAMLLPLNEETALLPIDR